MAADDSRSRSRRNKISLFDFSHPFFRPPYRRVLIVAACLAWAAFEFSTGSPFWAILFAGIGCIVGWKFFFERPDDKRPANEGDSEG